MYKTGVARADLALEHIYQLATKAALSLKRSYYIEDI